jgi:16S rRNA (cytosine1402-N4)-methyltransferase
VGHEFESLEQGLQAAAELIRPGGRIAVITFHSLEDRAVKQALRPYGRHAGRADWQVVRLGEVIRPEAAEQKMNPRSRSAKLRVFLKVRIGTADQG